MKTFKWAVAGALVGFGGVALADDYKDETKKEMREARQSWEHEGEDVRAGMERDAERAEEKVDRRMDRAEDRVDAAADDAARGAEEAGDAFSTSISEASSAVQGDVSELPQGALDDGQINHTLTTNPLGFFTGSGLNAQYSRPLSDKFSAVGGASLARVSLGEGAATRVGLQAGADYYLIGARNEGLRIGPRIEVGVGGETSGQNSVFGSVAALGEVGYNWISSRGLTAGVGGGLRAGLGGTTDNAPANNVDRVDANLSPYARLNLGFSW